MALMQAAAYLSYFTYIDNELAVPNRSDFARMLGTVPPGTANGPWALVWGPAANRGTLSYVARGADGDYAVAIRGTNPGYFRDKIRDLIDDIEFPLVDWPATPGLGMKLCRGTNAALTHIAQARAEDGTTLLDFLGAVGGRMGPRQIMVTGHSLGGTVAVVTAAWLQASLPAGAFAVVPKTFAAPAAWNGAFAAWCAKRFSYWTAVNENDVIPMLWPDLDQMLASFANGPKFKVYDKLGWDVFEAIRLAIALERYDYATLEPRFAFNFRAPLDQKATWFQNVERMHSMRYQYFPHATGHPAPDLPHAKT
jgi:Lipase (class 3)